MLVPRNRKRPSLYDTKTTNKQTYKQWQIAEAYSGARALGRGPFVKYVRNHRASPFKRSSIAGRGPFAIEGLD
jgi:hypothetical protein